jgi:hypothetical protein
MSSVIRLKPDKGSGRPSPGADSTSGDSQFDSVPNTVPPRGRRLATTPPASTKSHLAPCGQCGSLNGRSATVCWSCEADLLAVKPRVFSDAPEESTEAQPQAALPVLNSPLQADEVHSAPWELAEFEQPASVRRYTAEVVAAVCAIVFIGAGAYAYFSASDLPPTQVAPAQNEQSNRDASSGGNNDTDVKPAANQAASPSTNAAAPAAPAAVAPAVAATPPSTTTPPVTAQVATPAPALTPTVPSTTLPSTSESTATAKPSTETATPSPRAAEAEAITQAMAIAAPAKAVTAPVVRSKPITESRVRRSRAAQRTPAETQTAESPQSSRDKLRPAKANAVPAGPCTATIAALGLCSAPSTQ